MIGLALYTAGFPAVGGCVEVGLVQIVTVIIFSQYMKNIKIFGYRFFQLFPVSIALVLSPPFWPWSATPGHKQTCSCSACFVFCTINVRSYEG
jgi:hypothetical protein